MARNPIQTQIVASGMDATSDPVTMPLNRARSLVNYQIDRLGVLRNDLRFVNQLPAPSDADGVSWYYRATIRNNTLGIPFDISTDLLVWVAGGFLFLAIPDDDPLFFPVGNVSVQTGGVTGYAGSGAFFIGKRVRFAALQSELLMVQEGGLLLLRFYAVPYLSPHSGFYRAGIQPPLSSGSFSNLTLSATGTGLTGTWGYKLTFADERGRESSPTPVANITLSNQGTHAAFSTLYDSPPTAYSGSNLATAYLYRNTIGAPSVFYRIAAHTIPIFGTSFTFGSGDFFFDSAAYDDAPDVDIVSGTLAPSPGENDPPNPASIIAIWKNRVLLNDVTDSTTLQISNTLSPTQWTLIPTTPVTSTDGVRSEIGTEQGDPITAIVDFGSYAAIFKRRQCFFLSGNDLSDFIIQPVHSRGCISPDSCVRCDNTVLFLSDDGVYGATYGGGELVGKMSKEIESLLLATPIIQRETSYAWFVNNQYHLQVGEVTFIYNFDVQGWGTWDLGLVPALNAGDSGLIGGMVPSTPPVPCSVTLSESLITVAPEGGTVSVIITALNDSALEYLSTVSWATITGPFSGSGTATVTIEANPAAARVGAVSICGASVEIDQSALETPVVLSNPVCT